MRENFVNLLSQHPISCDKHSFDHLNNQVEDNTHGLKSANEDGNAADTHGRHGKGLLGISGNLLGHNFQLPDLIIKCTY